MRTELEGQETVLIVDDEKTFLLSLKDGLKIHEGKYRVLTAENGREAVSLLKALPVDLLVTDLKMPVMDGFELLAWTTRERPELPVIVMTAFGTAEIEAQLAEIETLQYLEKPLELADLERAISTALKAKSRSFIRGITLATFLQLMHMEKKSCTLKVVHAEVVGYLYLKGGELVDAECGRLQGLDAAYEIMAWEDAEIEMEAGCRRQEQAISIGLEHLLIDAFRRKDEKERDMSELRDAAFDVAAAPAAAPGAPQGERLKLIEVLERHPGVQEFALFDESGKLEGCNRGECGLREFDPAFFLMHVDTLASVMDFGRFGYLVFTTQRRQHCMVFRVRQQRVVARLVRGQRPAEVMKQVGQLLRG